MLRADELLATDTEVTTLLKAYNSASEVLTWPDAKSRPEPK